MITSVIRHILFIHCILLHFHTFSISVKTYQVQRINESSYLVTSFPDSEFETFYSKAYAPKDTEDKMIFLNPVKDSLITSSLEDVKVVKPNAKLPASYINKARDNYFKHYLTETKKPVVSNAGSPPLVTQEPALFNYDIKTNLELNLQKARNLASVLINESQCPDLEGKTKDKSIKNKDLIKRPRRRNLRKSIKNLYK